MMSVVKRIMHAQAWLVGHVNNSLESCDLPEIGKKRALYFGVETHCHSLILPSS